MKKFTGDKMFSHDELLYNFDFPFKMTGFAQFDNHLYNLRNVENTYEGVLLLVKWQAC